MAHKKLISLLIPVLNEEQNVMRAYESLNEVIDVLRDRYDFEFVFTDNHSSDDTFSILKELAMKDKNVKVLRFSKNFGYQRSIYSGYVTCSGDAAIQIDCDLQDPPEVILQFVEKWEEGYKSVYGIRVSRKEGFVITIVRRIFYTLIDALSNETLPHNVGDFRLIDRMLIDELKRINDISPYLRGIIASFGFDQIGVEYHRLERKYGSSEFNLRSMFGLAIDGMMNHSVVPLRIALYTGLIITMITIGGILFFFFGKIFIGENWPKGFTSLVVLILLSMMLNGLFLGIIGEYLGRIYQQVKIKPQVIVEETLNFKDD